MTNFKRQSGMLMLGVLLASLLTAASSRADDAEGVVRISDRGAGGVHRVRQVSLNGPPRAPGVRGEEQKVSAYFNATVSDNSTSLSSGSPACSSQTCNECNNCELCEEPCYKPCCLSKLFGRNHCNTCDPCGKPCLLQRLFNCNQCGDSCDPCNQCCLSRLFGCNQCDPCNQCCLSRLFGCGYLGGHDEGVARMKTPLKFGCYKMIYAANPYYADPRDSRVYAAEGYGLPVTVPLAPNVEHTYNYGWGIPSSRLTPVSKPPQMPVRRPAPYLGY